MTLAFPPIRGMYTSPFQSALITVLAERKLFAVPHWATTIMGCVTDSNY